MQTLGQISLVTILRYLRASNQTYHLSGFHLTFKDVAGFRNNTYSCRVRVEVGSGCFFAVPDVSFCVETNSWPLSSPYFTPSQRRRKSVFVAMLCFPGGSESKESACSAGDLGSVPGLGRSPQRRAWQPTLVFLPGESLWTEEPGRLQSTGSQRVGHNCVTK